MFVLGFVPKLSDATCIGFINVSSKSKTHKIIEYVSLMNMDGDEGFKLDSLKFAQVPRRLVNELVQHGQEALIGGAHNALFTPRISQGVLRVPCPDHLQSKQSHLQMHKDVVADIFSTWRSTVSADAHIPVRRPRR